MPVWTGRSKSALATVAAWTLIVVAQTAVPAGAVGTPTVTVLGSLQTVRPNVATPTGDDCAAGCTAQLTAARNEFESFQVTIEDPVDAALTNVSVGPGDPLTNVATGTVIPNEPNVTVYREAIYTATTPSDGEIEDRQDPDLWPDALIPEVDYLYGQNRNAWPWSPSGGIAKVTAWVDVLVPLSADGLDPTPSGTYEGTVEVAGTLDGGPWSQTVDVELTVLEMDMPSTSSLPDVFLTKWNTVCMGHYSTPSGGAYCGGNNGDEGWPERWRLHALYARVGLENRVSITNPWPLGQNFSPQQWGVLTEFRDHILPLIDGGNPNLAGVSDNRLPGAALTRLHLYFDCVGTCLSNWKSEATTSGFLDKLIYYACDEPSDGHPTPEWRWSGEAGCVSRLNSPTGLPMLVTTMINEAVNHDVVDKIDILVPNVNRMHDKAGAYTGNQRYLDPAGAFNSYDEFIAPANNPAGTAPNELWMYTSNMSFGSDGPGSAGWDGTYWDGWPGYGIDQPASQHRAFGWMASKYEAPGELYWQTTQRTSTAWNAGGLYEQGGNGDGTLLYPGKTSVIGGTTDIPIESIRLKRIRDGREDYEYMKWLTDQGEGAFVDSVVDGVFPAMSSATVSQSAFDAARAQLIAKINELSPPTTVLTKIVFAKDILADGLNADIFIANSDGSDPVNLTDSPEHESMPSLDSTGSKIAFMRDEAGNQEIYVMDVDGSNQVNITDDPADDSKPAFSPSGAAIAFVRQAAGEDEEIWSTTTDGLTSHNVSNDPTRHDYDPSWSTGEMKIVYASRPTSGGNADIFTMMLDGTGKTNLTNSPDNDDDLPMWSSRDQIAYDSYDPDVGNYEIWVMDHDGSDGQNITNHLNNDYAPAWNPAGTQLLYVSGVGPVGSDSVEIHKITRTGTALGSVTGDDFEDAHPDWGTFSVADEPDTTVTSGPSGTVTNRTATFTFSSTYARSTFRCRLDQGTFTACSSPKTYTNLADGSHAFEVKALLPDTLEDPVPAVRNWTVDAPDPTSISLSLTKKPSRLIVSGRVLPNHAGDKVTVKLYRKRSGTWNLLSSKSPTLSSTSRYSSRFGRPKPGSCKLIARFPGDADHKSSSVTKQFRC